MPHKFKIRKIDEVIKALELIGYEYIRQKGSHIRMSNNSHKITIPNHKEISIGTLNSIYKEILLKSNVDPEKINKLFLS